MSKHLTRGSQSSVDGMQFCIQSTDKDYPQHQCLKYTTKVSNSFLLLLMGCCPGTSKFLMGVSLLSGEHPYMGEYRESESETINAPRYDHADINILYYLYRKFQ